MLEQDGFYEFYFTLSRPFCACLLKNPLIPRQGQYSLWLKNLPGIEDAESDNFQDSI